MGKFKRRKYVRSITLEQIKVLPSSKKEGGRTIISIMHGGKQVWKGEQKDLLQTLVSMFVEIIAEPPGLDELREQLRLKEIPRLPDVFLWSDDAKRELLLTIIKLIHEAVHKKGLILHRKLGHGTRMGESSYEDALCYMWDTLLAGKGLGLLPGFGMAICEKTEEGKRRMMRRLFINPEKTSIYKEH